MLIEMRKKFFLVLAVVFVGLMLLMLSPEEFKLKTGATDFNPLVPAKKNKMPEGALKHVYSSQGLNEYLDNAAGQGEESEFAQKLTAAEKAFVAEVHFSLHSISDDVHENTRGLIEYVKSDLQGNAKQFRSLWEKAEEIHSVKRDLLYLAGEAGMLDFVDIVEDALAEDPYPYALDSPTVEHDHHHADETLYFEEYSVQNVALASLKKLVSDHEYKKALKHITLNCGQRHICADAVTELMTSYKMNEAEILSWLPDGYNSVYFEVLN